MKIDVRNSRREKLGVVIVDDKEPASVVKPDGPPQPPQTDGDANTGEVYLSWDGAVDDQGYLRRCPVCGCRELFSRKDFPQITGFVIVVLAGVLAMGLFVGGDVYMGLIVLGACAVLDALIYFFVGRCIVCYRCRSEFRDTPIGSHHQGWDLAVGEKYRPVRQDAVAEREAKD